VEGWEGGAERKGGGGGGGGEKERDGQRESTDRA